ncbi:hypothetical protein [uncultured Thermanaerothrix sp.]|uniref:hypothetical protein n=1 Tax=uncultured Thermanaerothrix sp. TaxID=1195149 RepID=UPI00260277E1|nr:hypothetical protein [uncultured Thermanaerothrix sp.]
MTPLQEAAYRHLLSLLPPGRYPREGGAADGLVRMLGGLEGKLVEEVLAVLAETFPQSASKEGLGELALGRGMRLLPGEYLDAFRERVRLARVFWEKAGTLPGVLLWLRVAGYRATIWEHYHDDPAIWAEFSVYLWLEIAAYTTDRWDDGVGSWDDDTPWDYQLAATELSRIPNLLREVKPAHARVRRVWYIAGPFDAWDDGGTWDDGGVWNPEPIQVV